MTQTPDSIATDNGFTYSGDMDISYGGTFCRVSDCRNYADIVEVIDMSNAGNDGEHVIEARVVPLDMAGKARIKTAFQCCGMTARGLAGTDRNAKADQIARALHSYGYSDPFYMGYRPSDETLTDASEADILNAVNEMLGSM